MTSRRKLAAMVVARAGSRCEYCRMLQALQGGKFHIEHIVPSSRGGPTELTNLALACPSCNLRKSDRLECTDPKSGKTGPLFHPRRHLWRNHFQWRRYKVIGRTGIGRATVAFLDLNQPRRIAIRKAEELYDLFNRTLFPGKRAS